MRNTQADIAKGIGIILVVVCHANFAPAAPGRYFHMALFFFLTGWLSSFSSDFIPFAKSKLKHLYLPFIICELAFFALHKPLEAISLTPAYTEVWWKELLHILCFDNIETQLSQLWFLPALFFSNFICWGLVKSIRNKPYLLLLCSTVLLCLGLCFTRMHWLQLPSYNFKEGINVVLVAQFFIVLGYLIKQCKLTFDKWQITTIAIIWLFIAKLVFDTKIDMRTNSYSNIFIWITLTFAGIYATMYFAQLFDKYKPIQKTLAYIGKNSLIILFLHIFCFKLVGLLQVHCFGYDIANLPRWENLSTAWYWALAYSFTGLAIPLGIKITWDRLTTKFAC